MRYADARDQTITFAGRSAADVVRQMARDAWLTKPEKAPYMLEVSRRCAEVKPDAPPVDPRAATPFLATLVAAGFLVRKD